MVDMETHLMEKHHAFDQLLQECQFLMSLQSIRTSKMSGKFKKEWQCTIIKLWLGFSKTNKQGKKYCELSFITGSFQ